MRTDLQGAGSYVYECDKEGCYFCYLTKRNEQLTDPKLIIKPVIVDITQVYLKRKKRDLYAKVFAPYR